MISFIVSPYVGIEMRWKDLPEKEQKREIRC